MPKDEWANAKARDVAIKAPGGIRGKPKKRKRGQHHKHKRTCAYSMEMKIWFGKHKDKPLKDVPAPYLRWLTDQTPGSSWQINSLCEYLRNRPTVGN